MINLLTKNRKPSSPSEEEVKEWIELYAKEHKTFSFISKKYKRPYNIIKRYFDLNNVDSNPTGGYKSWPEQIVYWNWQLTEKLGYGGYWKCVCLCGSGKTRKTTLAQLKDGRSKSCGCLNRGMFYNNSYIPDHILNTCYHNAKKRGLSFNVTPEYLKSIIEKQKYKCALSGVDIYLSEYKQESSASIDRIDSSIGYIKGNIQWLHYKVNILKLDYANQEIISLAKEVVKNAKK